jgi:hypothetical protein
MVLTPEDIEAVAEAVVRKSATDEGLRRIFREEIARLLVGESAPIQPTLKELFLEANGLHVDYNPLLMDERQLRFAERLLATDEERKILRTRVFGERAAAQGNNKAAAHFRRKANKLEIQFEAKSK